MPVDDSTQCVVANRIFLWKTLFEYYYEVQAATHTDDDGSSHHISRSESGNIRHEITQFPHDFFFLMLRHNDVVY